MNLSIFHGDLLPLGYGIIMMLGLLSTLIKFKMGWYTSLFLDVAVFILVFWLHGGTMAGGFAAMTAALLSGLIFPLILKM